MALSVKITNHEHRPARTGMRYAVFFQCHGSKSMADFGEAAHRVHFSLLRDGKVLEEYEQEANFQGDEITSAFHVDSALISQGDKLQIKVTQGEESALSNTVTAKREPPERGPRKDDWMKGL